jgi:hypothetical protein
VVGWEGQRVATREAVDPDPGRDANAEVGSARAEHPVLRRIGVLETVVVEMGELSIWAQVDMAGNAHRHQ